MTRRTRNDLTARDRQVILMLIAGESTRYIAAAMGISHAGVGKILERARVAMEFANTYQLVAFVAMAEIMTPQPTAPDRNADTADPSWPTDAVTERQASETADSCRS